MAAHDTKPMNVVMVLADQMHAQLMGCTGHPQAISPNLDAFAAQGVRFDHAYCQNPICTPSRVSILSGQYCHNHGYYGLSGPAWFELPNLFRHFRAHGYRTSAHGKLHLPNDPRNWIANDVDLFDDSYETIDGRVGESLFFDHLKAHGLREVEDSWHNPWSYGKPLIDADLHVSQMPYEMTQERVAVARSLAFIDQYQTDKPFCIQIAFQKPHHPLTPQQQFLDQYPEDLALPSTFDDSPAHRPPNFQTMWQRLHADDQQRLRAQRVWRGTLACVTQIDDVFGILLRELAKRGLGQNTIVIFGSDHGGYHAMHGLPEKAPGICSQDICRVPMLWRLPGLSQSGHVCKQLVENIDMVPTLSSLCHLPSMNTADGLDISPLLQGSDQPVREVAVTENVWSKSLRWKQWRSVHYQSRMHSQDQGELYDIESDPEERTNLYASRPDVAESCRRKLLEWLITTTRVRTTNPPQQHVDLPAMPGLKHGIYPVDADGKTAACRTLQPNLNYW